MTATDAILLRSIVIHWQSVLLLRLGEAVAQQLREMGREGARA